MVQMMAHPAANNKHADESGATLPQGFLRLWLCLLIAFAAWLRISGAGFYALSADEAVIRNMSAGNGFGQVWQFSHYEAPAPLANMIRHAWMLFSVDPAWLRSLSLLFGLALVPLYFSIGRRLGGPLGGMVCAALIAFSHGCIIQSYIVRNYTIFAFFLSLCFYYCLRLREGGGTVSLLIYAICGCLAVLCNISAAFAILCLAPLEALRLRRIKAPLRKQASWALANAAILGTAAAIYLLWSPLLVPLASYFAAFRVAPEAKLSYALHYPLALGSYLLPGRIFAILLLFFIPAFCLMRLKHPHRFIYCLAGLAILLGMALGITNIYPYPGTRRSLWALPFIVSAAGVMLAQSCRHFLAATRRTQATIAFALLALGFIFYSPAGRFMDFSEYALPQAAWDDAGRALAALTHADLIITERDDGALLANLYAPIGQDAFTGTTMMATAPWRDLTILYNPYYPRSYTTSVFLAGLEEADAKGLLDSVQRIVFFSTAWSRSPLLDLMLCPQLEKTLLLYPPLPEGRTLTRQRIHASPIALTIVSRQVLEDDVLSPHGKARACLDGRHDMVPDALPTGQTLH